MRWGFELHYKHICAHSHTLGQSVAPQTFAGAEEPRMLAPFSPLSPSALPFLLAQMHFRDNGNKDNENWVKNADRSFVVGGFTMTEPLGHVLC